MVPPNIETPWAVTVTVPLPSKSRVPSKLRVPLPATSTEAVMFMSSQPKTSAVSLAVNPGGRLTKGTSPGQRKSPCTGDSHSDCA